jgi:hypothetical protein
MLVKPWFVKNIVRTLLISLKPLPLDYWAMTDDEAATHFLARAACYRCGAEHVTNPHLAGLYRLSGEGLENLAKAQKIKPAPRSAFVTSPGPPSAHLNALRGADSPTIAGLG